MTTHIGHADHAPWWVRAFGPVARRLLTARVPLGPNRLLTIRGRSSGMLRTTPLAVIEDAGRRWVWAPWGEVNWVRNLRAAGEATIRVGGLKDEVRAVELDPAQRVAFFRDVLGPWLGGSRSAPPSFASSTVSTSTTRSRPLAAGPSSSSLVIGQFRRSQVARMVRSIRRTRSTTRPTSKELRDA
jgi:deazaflavin-dependent oxidoreductase (nitroreductase family)